MEGVGKDPAAAGVHDRKYLWWATATTVQLAWGIAAYRRGYNGGDSRLMPLKAFAVASLFVGATATAAFTTLSAYGIHSVRFPSSFSLSLTW